MSIVSYLLGPAGIILLGAGLVAFGGFWAAIKNDQSQVLLQHKTEQIASLNKEMSQIVTGGDSFPYIQVSIDVKTDTVLLNLMGKGKYPIHNIHLSIDDYYLASKLLGGPDSKIYQNTKHIPWRKAWEIGTLNPGTANMHFYSFILKEGEGPAKLGCWISTLNGNYFQSLEVSRNNKGLEIESEVLKDNKVIYTFSNKKKAQ